MSNIHFIHVIFETDAYYYSCYLDMIDTLYEIYRQRLPEDAPTFSIFWDSDKQKKAILHTFSPQGTRAAVSGSSQGISKVSVDRNMNFSETIVSFLDHCISTVSASKRIFSFYTHGNIWYLRHAGKYIPFVDIFSKIQYKFDIVCLESCYCASVEMCLEVSRIADFYIASECTRARCAIIQPDTIRQLIQYRHENLSSEHLAYYLADTFMNKIDSLPPRDKTILELSCDVAVIDLQQFVQFYPYLLSLQINRQVTQVFKEAKVTPKFKPDYLGYDVYSIVEGSNRYSLPEKQTFSKIFHQVVPYYRQSKYLRQKPFAKRSHGLCWSPAPYDSEQGSSYKYTTAFRYLNDLTIYTN